MHFDKLIEIVNGFESRVNFLLMGDYNFADSISWRTDSNGICKPDDIKGSIASAFVDFLAITNLCKFNSVKNANNRSLDVVLSNIDTSKLDLIHSDNVLLYEDRHHPALNVTINVDPLKIFDEKRPPKTNFFRANYDQLNVSLSEINLDDELNSLDLDDAMLKFYDILKPIIDVIRKTRNENDGYPHWYSAELIDLIKQKESSIAKLKYSEKYKLDSVEVDRLTFVNLRKSVKNLIENKIDVNPKAFFSYTKSLHKSNSLPNRMRLNDVSADKSSEMCDLFDSFFESVYDKRVADGIYEEVNNGTFYEEDGANPFQFTITRPHYCTQIWFPIQTIHRIQSS